LIESPQAEAARFTFANDQPSDQVAGNDKKHIDPDKTSRQQALVQMK
jgi:hypothetical protein